MLEPKAIIELDTYLTKENIVEITHLLETKFNINKVEIYEEHRYVDDSEFASVVYDRMFRILCDEN